MRIDKLTSKLQSALADAQSIAVGKDHNFIEPVHLMQALMDQQGGSIKPLLQQIGVEQEPPPLPRLPFAALLHQKPAVRDTAENEALEVVDPLSELLGGGRAENVCAVWRLELHRKRVCV